MVSYFYFPGIEEIYQNIQDKKMRILGRVGNEQRFAK